MTEKSQLMLTQLERGFAYAAALILTIFGIVIGLFPTKDITEVQNGVGKISSMTFTSHHNPELAVLFVASGLLLFILGLNGLRLSRISVGSVSAESREVQAAQQSAPLAAQATEVLVKEDKATEPESDSPAKGKVIIDSETEYVYPLESVPRFVFEDLFKNWPEGLDKPMSFGDFEFASRRKGKGNFPWLVKFESCPIIRVSYGGYAKQDPTVSPESS